MGLFVSFKIFVFSNKCGCALGFGPGCAPENILVTISGGRDTGLCFCDTAGAPHKSICQCLLILRLGLLIQNTLNVYAFVYLFIFF